MIRPRVGAWFSRGRIHPYIAATLHRTRKQRPRPSVTPIVALAVVGGILGLIAGALTSPLGALAAGVTVGVAAAIWAVAHTRRQP